MACSTSVIQLLVWNKQLTKTDNNYSKQQTCEVSQIQPHLVLVSVWAELKNKKY